MSALLSEQRAQATVEMAVVLPVLIVLGLIVYNIMVFSSAVARFDRVVPDIVIAHGLSPSASSEEGSDPLDGSDDVATQIKEAMKDYGVEIEVSVDSDKDGEDSLLALVGATRTYVCTMRYRPWPSSLSIASVDMGAPASLSHARSVTVDPWRSGVLA